MSYGHRDREEERATQERMAEEEQRDPLYVQVDMELHSSASAANPIIRSQILPMMEEVRVRLAEIYGWEDELSLNIADAMRMVADAANTDASEYYGKARSSVIEIRTTLTNEGRIPAIRTTRRLFPHFGLREAIDWMKQHNLWDE